MPVRPTTTRDGPWGPPPGWTPTAGDVVSVGAVFNMTYTAIVIYALANPDGLIGGAVGKWVEICRKVLGPAYVLAGSAGCGGAKVSPFVARAWVFDIHLKVINLIVVAILIAGSRRYWPSWSGQLYGTLDRLGLKGDAIHQGADAGYVTVLCGAIAPLWWLLLENDLFESAAHCITLQPWLLLRVPLLTTTAHAFACVAAAFWVARER